MANPVKKFFRALYFPLFFVVILWIIHIYKITFLDGYPSLGIYPRETFGLQGILTAPLSHGDFEHLISNSAPLLVSLTMIFLFYRRVAYLSFVLIYLLTGAAVWLFAREVFHIGASGVVYGLISFIFWSGIFRRNIKSIVLSLIIVVMYSGILIGVVPNQDGISWESHLFGAIVGMFVAYLLRKLIERDEQPKRDPWIDDDDRENFYLDRDTFEFTKEERNRFRRNQDLDLDTMP